MNNLDCFPETRKNGHCSFCKRKIEFIGIMTLFGYPMQREQGGYYMMTIRVITIEEMVYLK